MHEGPRLRPGDRGPSLWGHRSHTVHVRKHSLRILALALLLSSCAAPASLNGLVVPRKLTPDERLDYAVVYLESKDPSIEDFFPPRESRVALTFNGRALEPVVAVARTGASLELWNADSVFHQPFSRSLAAPFDGRSVRPGSGTAVKLRAKGLIQIFCQLHENESAEVLVLDSGAWARPDITGAFTLPPLPRGRYTIHAWHPRLGEQSMPVEIDGSGPMSVELRY